ncbi:hypothetical protein G7046_g2073 [Stylonectria norvegica]|nr:hypothetical protein G7046_g2073 [Stylonectria norvegica]
MTFLPDSQNIIQLRLDTKDDPVLHNTIFFTGKLLRRSDSRTTEENAHKQLEYGDFEDVSGTKRPPSISINPYTDILYISVEPRQLHEIILLYPEFLREAKYLAMDYRLAYYFFRDMLPQNSILAQFRTNRGLFEGLTELFIVVPQVDECKGVLKFEKDDGIEAPFADEIVKMQLAFTTSVVSLVFSSRPCSHLPNIHPCEFTEAEKTDDTCN